LNHAEQLNNVGLSDMQKAQQGFQIVQHDSIKLCNPCSELFVKVINL